jgi:hypothetical protein
MEQSYGVPRSEVKRSLLMIKRDLAAVAVALSVAAFGVSFAPVSSIAFPSPAPALASSNVQLATVVKKKKVVVKKHGDVKKRVVVKKTTPSHRSVYVAPRPSVHVAVKTRPHCKTVVRTVKSHGKMVKTTRRVC